MAGARTGWLPLLARGRSLERGSGEALRFFQHRFWATGCEALWLAVRENRRSRLDVVGLQSCRGRYEDNVLVDMVNEYSVLPHSVSYLVVHHTWHTSRVESDHTIEAKARVADPYSAST